MMRLKTMWSRANPISIFDLTQTYYYNLLDDTQFTRQQMLATVPSGFWSRGDNALQRVTHMSTGAEAVES